MKINIYYGGRGVLDDPTLYVLARMEHVLTELRVEVRRYNIYEYKNEISTLPQTIKDADAIILAATVEWFGVGGYMYQFLDACWLYGDKDRISGVYMQPVVISKAYGEREGMLTLENAWETLGGLPCAGLCGYVENRQTFEANPDYARIIEKKAENLYRTVSQHAKGLPTSNQAVTKTVLHSEALKLTPEESEQLSEFVSDDNYVRQQKEDIEELSSVYRSLIGREPTPSEEFFNAFKSHFHPAKDFSATYLFDIDEREKPLFIQVTPKNVTLEYADHDTYDVLIKVTPGTMNEITAGRETFQRAFGVGDITAKGNLRILRMLDTVFDFSE